MFKIVQFALSQKNSYISVLKKFQDHVLSYLKRSVRDRIVEEVSNDLLATRFVRITLRSAQVKLLKIN